MNQLWILRDFLSLNWLKSFSEGNVDYNIELVEQRKDATRYSKEEAERLCAILHLKGHLYYKAEA